MNKIIDLNTFAEGALAERANVELQKILENIADPNTDPKKKRTLTITINLAADDKRDVVLTSVVAKSKLAPAKDIQAKLIMDLDSRGKVTGAELKSGIKGQTFIDVDTGEILDDTGNQVAVENKIINFKNN
ncbi:replication terminator protein [Caldibacillus lycopersici]|uniref:Replication terminator protein n=1 Tax=Perspicuibacillus lycopersici TaxID=1325689 RepID=A0AAE3LNR4_9BACI|nr:replication terminator protein [Perspicuibacillus lycopersici]MCU9614112.1 replication terminator protein [Perspicuibacillus lycopersici]